MARRPTKPHHRPPSRPPAGAERAFLRVPPAGDANLLDPALAHERAASQMLGQMELTGEALYAAVRQAAGRNLWVETCLTLKAAFANFGLRLAPTDKKRKDAFRAWLERPAPQERDGRNRDVIAMFVRECWQEWLLQDNLIPFWRDGGRPPLLLLPEAVRYTDTLGLEQMRVRVRLTAQQLKAAGLSEAQMKRYATGEITLDEAQGEYYRLARRGLRGQGLARPRLARCLLTTAQTESMEAGEALWAYAGRLVQRQHKIGFEVKTSALAPQQVNFLYDPDRAEAIETEFRHKQGLFEYCSQFDHKVEHIWPGLETRAFDGRKWGTISARLAWWAGGLGQMLLGGNAPHALTLLRTELVEERLRLAPVMEDALTQALSIPGGLRLQWSQRCFADLRMAWQMAVDLMRQGPLSLQRALEEAGFDPEEEAERKEAEAPASQDARYLPKFDASHGQKPSAPNGRPPKAQA